MLVIVRFFDKIQFSGECTFFHTLCVSFFLTNIFCSGGVADKSCSKDFQILLDRVLWLLFVAYSINIFITNA